MKLSENIEFIYKVGIPPARSVLGSWQEMARELEARAENLDDRLRATKAELESCRAAIKGKNEHIQGLNARTIRAEGQNKSLEDQVMTRDNQISRLKATLGRRDDMIDRLKRITVENENVVALNKHIAKLTSENQQQKHTIRHMQDVDKNQLEAVARLEKTADDLRKALDAEKQTHDICRNAVARRREEIAELRRMNGTQAATIKSLNADIAALNKRIADVGAESQRRGGEIGRLEATIKDLKRVLTESEMRASLAAQQAKDANAACARQHSTTRQLEDQNKNLEAALVKAEGQVRCLQGLVDVQTTLFHAAPAPAHNLAVQVERQRRTIDEQREELAKTLKKQSDETERADYNAKAAIRLELEVGSLRKRNNNQSGFIREHQQEIRKLREQLEAEKAKAGPVQDIYKDSKLEVRLLNDGAVEVLEYGGGGQNNRLRSTKELVDLRTKVARREVELTRWQRSASITEYDQWNSLLARYNNVPVKVN